MTPTTSNPSSPPKAPPAQRRADTGRASQVSGRGLRLAVAVFAAGAILIAGGLALALAQSPPRLLRIGAPGVKAITPSGAPVIATTNTGALVCQAGEVLPAGAWAVRVSLWAFLGARVHVMAFRGSDLLTEGTRGPSWTGDSVTVPVKPLSHGASDVRICVSIEPNDQLIELIGPSAPRAQAAKTLAAGVSPTRPSPGGERAIPGRLVIEYLAPGHVSWLSRLPAVARRLGLGRAYGGTWIALLLAGLMAAVAALAVRLTLREMR